MSRSRRLGAAVSNTYYQDELHYLRNTGPEFAARNPEIARFLADRGSDPDVERILEGVAFLCGRIRQKLDDELPELTANMMALLWPHYLRPIPSMSILELLPSLDAMRSAAVVEAGAEFASIPVAGTRCCYRSAWPTVLRPWRLREVRLETAAAQPLRLVLVFGLSAKAKPEDMQLGSVRLHLAGDPRVSFPLYWLLAAHVEKVTVAAGGSGKHEVVLGPEAVTPAGLEPAEGVLPYPPHAFAGYRLLQEYFAFKERFLFVDLKGLDRASTNLEIQDTIVAGITFNRRLETPPVVLPENVRLHCVPIINLLSQPAEPIRLQHDRTSYLAQPSNAGVADRRHLEIYSIDRVAGLSRSGVVESREYAPFYSFQHGGGGRRERFYQVHLQPNVLGGDPRMGTDTYVSFVPDADPVESAAEETISMELTCTNRNLPAELRAGDIVEPTDRSPREVRFRNILKPSATIPPPLGKHLHWRLISHLSLNYVSLLSAEHFRELLRIYDFQSELDPQRGLAHRRLLEGIVGLHSEFHERMIYGAPVRGSRIELTVNEDHFAGEGDAFLFACILDRFVSLYGTLNSYTQLTVTFSRTGWQYTFAPRWGQQLTPAEARG